MKINMPTKPVLRFAFLPVVLIICSVSFAQHPGWTVYNTSNSGLPGGAVFSMAIDGRGNKWIGTG